MPELPEVETIVKELKEGVRVRPLFDCWTDFYDFKYLKREIIVKGRKII